MGTGNGIHHAPEVWHWEADVVVIGYGGAGSCSAIAAHDAGQEVLVLEKAPVGGGNTGCCGGGMRIPKDVDAGVAYYTALTRGVDAHTLRVFAEAMHSLPARLEKWGADLEWIKRPLDFPTLPGAEAFGEVVSIARSPEEKTRQAGGPIFAVRGDGLFAFLDERVRKRGIKLLFDTPAVNLIQDPESREIVGVVARTRDGHALLNVKARKGVVLACGGFQANREMIENYLPYMTELPTSPYGTPYNTGDGIHMATEVGAKLWHMAGVELGQFAPRAASEKYGVGLRLEKVMRPHSQAIYVNKAARRFMDEGKLLSHRKDLFQVQQFDHEAAEYPNIPLFMVFDDEYRRKRPIVGGHMGWWWVHKLHKWSQDNNAEVEAGWILKAASIAELASKLGLDQTALEATVAEFNAACAAGADEKFGRSRESMAPLLTPPFYATELCQPIINTQGGPKRNAHAQVLDRHDRPIRRLYAAGELGSFFYPLYESASNVPEALAFGIIAGEHASQLTSWDLRIEPTTVDQEKRLQSM